MEAVLALNEPLARTPDGCIWNDSSFAYQSVQRYLTVFDRVRLVARVRDIERAGPHWQRVDGPGVDLLRIPHFQRRTEYLRKTIQVHRALEAALDEKSAAILRMPAWHITGILAERLHRKGHPFAVEVCGAAGLSLAPAIYRDPLRTLYRQWIGRRTQQFCQRAIAALYVTEQFLQRQYRADTGAYVVGCSDVILPEAAFKNRPRRFEHRQEPWRLVFVGSMSQPNKAADVLIKAVARCIRDGQTLRLGLVGDGRLQPALQRLAGQLGISRQVRMIGKLRAGESIRSELDNADLFVLPSHQEGLPRAMLEAMARGLPCVGSAVGGIPELLDAEDLVPPGDPAALAEKINQVLGNSARMERMAARNWQKAQEFLDHRLAGRRCEFYRAVKSRTEDSLARAKRGRRHPTTPGKELFKNNLRICESP